MASRDFFFSHFWQSISYRSDTSLYFDFFLSDYLEKYISFSFSLYLVKFLVAGILFLSLSHVYLQFLFLYLIVKLIKKEEKYSTDAIESMR